MIDIALLLLRDELTNYLSTKDTITVVIDNIGLLETPSGSTLSDNIVITLVNIEEDRGLKNQFPVNTTDVNSRNDETAPVYLNLYVLFTCNYSGNSYVLALKRLSSVIAFMRNHPFFSGSSAVSGTAMKSDHNELANLKFRTELYALTLEQVNLLWGSLGGRQVPFAVYKLSGIVIK